MFCVNESLLKKKKLAEGRVVNENESQKLNISAGKSQLKMGVGDGPLACALARCQ